MSNYNLRCYYNNAKAINTLKLKARDSSFLKDFCIKFGYWIIFDNLESTRPEVIKRINSLGEENAFLHV